MKKIIASTGMVALSAASLQAQAYGSSAAGADSAKSWSVNGALRGFYDSNSTASTSGFEVDSWGIGVEVGAGYNLPLDQTFFGVDYTYGLKYYEGRPSGKTDQSHKFNLKLDHSFTERYKIELDDSFVVSNEPTVVDSGTAITARTLSDAIRNRASLDFTAQFTQQLGLTIGYGNNFYDYDQEASDVGSPTLAPSRSQLLDRMEHLVPVDFRYTINPETIALIGYQYGMTEYSDGNAYAVLTPTGLQLANPSWRDTQSHFGYVGVEHNFNPQMNGALNVGVQHITYDNVPASFGLDDSRTQPYVDGTMSYLYNPGSYLVVGYRYSNNTTDLTVLDAQTHLAYLSWTHRITTRLNANLTYQFQHSTLDQGFDGGLNDATDVYNIFGFNLSYLITQNLTAEAGYNFDDLDSEVAGRSYTRHIVYLGIRASY